MISRVAEGGYWLQRHMERAESMARILGVTSGGGLDGELPVQQRWTPLLVVAGEYPQFVQRYGVDASARQDDVLDYLTWDTQNPVSIYSCVKWARENARIIRETISRETWESINATWLWMDAPASRTAWRDDPAGFYRHMRDAGHQFRGAVVGTMPDTEPLWFMNLGMYMERANQTARILDVRHHALGPTRLDKLDNATDMVTWVQILLACGAYESFFKRNRGTVRGYRVARFLLLDHSLPRSVLYCLDKVDECLQLVQSLDPEPRALRSQAALGSVQNILVDRSIEDIIESGMHEQLTKIIDGIIELGNSLYVDFFAPSYEPPLPSAPAELHSHS